jgi:hypothetical protein
MGPNLASQVIYYSRANDEKNDDGRSQNDTILPLFKS